LQAGVALQQGQRAGGRKTKRDRSIFPTSLYFDDGHNAGIYSWETLYKLGKNYDACWQDYLKRLEAAGHTRKEG
jgi:DUF971 family protein